VPGVRCQVVKKNAHCPSRLVGTRKQRSLPSAYYLKQVSGAGYGAGEKLYAMLALYFAWYNFCRVHQTLRVTPGMQVGIANHVWELEELLTWQT
jgi:hypothetical protein